MMLYADEDFSGPTVEELRQLGHDVLTAQDDNHRATPDPLILARALSLGRIVLTFNRGDYAKLHNAGASHCGIVSATHDKNFAALALRIDASIRGVSPGRWHIRVN